MNKRQTRLALIVDILLHNTVGSQEELLNHLIKRKCAVTQATLSRDLKTLRTSKVATDMGGYRYVIAANGTPTEEVAAVAVDAARQSSIISINITGNLVVIKTRSGYAGSIASDIDVLTSPLILGTVAGMDTLFVAVAENASREELYELLCTVLPENIMIEGRHNFIRSN